MNKVQKKPKKAIVITTKLYKNLASLEEWELIEEWAFEGKMLHDEECGVRAYLKYKATELFGIYVVPCTDPDTAGRENRGQFLEELIEAVIRHGEFEINNIYLFVHDKDLCPIGNKDELAVEDVVSATIKMNEKLRQLVNIKHVRMFIHDDSSHVGNVVADLDQSFGDDQCDELFDIVAGDSEMINFFASVNRDDRYYEINEGGKS